MSLKTVAVLQVNCNDEDCNFITNDLHSIGYEVENVVIPENTTLERDIISTLTQKCDILLIVGNKSREIFNAVAEATSQDLKENKNILENICIPVTTKLLKSEKVICPVYEIQRIFIIDCNYVRDLYCHILKDHLFQYQKPAIYKKIIHIQKNGKSKEYLLEYIQSKNINIQINEEDYTFIVYISSDNFDDVCIAEAKIKSMGNINYLSYEDNLFTNDIYFNSKLHVKEAIHCIEKSFEKYGIDNIFLSFNGGKDCTVLLHLVKVILKIKYPNYTNKVFCLYVKSKYPFAEQEKFIAQCAQYFNLQIMDFENNIKAALQTVLDKNPNYQACLMGTRRTDPYSQHLQCFQMTDTGWPQIMRISPILDWHYSDVWDYLLFYKVPYCKLYDMGYTSLGNSTNTIKNPSLKMIDAKGEETYLPAYKMLHESKERSGRNIK